MPTTTERQTSPKQINDIRRAPQPQHPSQPPKKTTKIGRRLSRKHKLIIALAVVLLLVGSGMFYAMRRDGTETADVHAIQKAVGRHIVVPQDEEPVLATVTDTSKITTPFLRQSENGDKILIYQKAKKVIIYRPSIDRIIDTGPLSMGSQ